MKISTEFPPNYQAIVAVFGDVVEKEKACFAYGDTIYNPFKIEITPDLEAHEKVHCSQQGDDVEGWWYKYLIDPAFRISQEIEAFGYQFAYFSMMTQNSKLKEWVKEQFASKLASPLYGDAISYGEAESKIRNFAKKVEITNDKDEVLLSRRS